MLNFLSFLVLLYVSGHFKQKKNFKIFETDRKISSPIHVVYSILKLFPNRLIFGWWLKAGKKPSKRWRLKSRLSVSAIRRINSSKMWSRPCWFFPPNYSKFLESKEKCSKSCIAPLNSWPNSVVFCLPKSSFNLGFGQVFVFSSWKNCFKKQWV